MTAHPDAVSTAPLDVRIVRTEFVEMPGMRLTLAQAARLWDLSEGHCRRILDGLVADGFLVVDSERRYARYSVLHRTTRAFRRGR